MSRLRRGIIAAGAGGAPAPSCAITFTTDITAGFPGSSPADIDGQSFSVTDASAGIYLASTIIFDPMPTPESAVPMPESGIKWIMGKDFYASASPVGTSARAGFIVTDSEGGTIGVTQLSYNESLGWFVLTEVPVGNSLPGGILANQQEGSYSFGIGADGNVYVYDRATSSAVSVTGTDAPFAAGALLWILTSCDLTGGGPASAGGEVVTAGGGLIDPLVGEDYCGNEL